MRYFIEFSYNGTNYNGWQSQPNATSVQQTLTNAMALIIKTPIQLHGAGRTDTGVHASQMFAHFDTETKFDFAQTKYKLNGYLPNNIVVQQFISVHNDAHTRFDAIKRTYQYHIHTHKNAFLNDQSWFYPQILDIDLMNQAAQLLFNYTDFESFSKTNTDVNTYNCKIYEAFWSINSKQLIFTISADRFLRNMVRAIVGTLIYVGLKKITLQDFKNIIESKDRQKAGFSVPACGLFLTNISYDYLPN